jgi:SnoaL-like domain
MTASMLDESAMRDLFDRLERIWNQGQLNLVASCVAEHYTRHDENGDRTITRDAYAKEIAQTLAERPNLHVVVYDHAFRDDRVWFRFSYTWTDPKTREQYCRAGVQTHRVEGSQLAESWLSLMPLGSMWTDPVRQEHWTSPPPIGARPVVEMGN